MDALIGPAVALLARTLLTRFVRVDEDVEKLSASFRGGEVVLHNAEINLGEALLAEVVAKLPVRVTRAKARETAVRVPWGRLESAPMVVTLSDVLLELDCDGVNSREDAEGVQPDAPRNVEPEAQSPHIPSEDVDAAPHDATGEEQQQEKQQKQRPKGWLISLVSRIFRNATVRYQNLTVRLVAADGVVATLSLGEFAAFNVDEGGAPAINGDDIVRKEHLARDVMLAVDSTGGGGAGKASPILSIPSGNVLVTVPLVNGLPHGQCDIRVESAMKELRVHLAGTQAEALRGLIASVGGAVASWRASKQAASAPSRSPSSHALQQPHSVGTENGEDGAESMRPGSRASELIVQRSQRRRSMLSKTWSFMTNEGAYAASQGFSLPSELENELVSSSLMQVTFSLVEVTVSAEFVNFSVVHADVDGAIETRLKASGLALHRTPLQFVLDLADICAESTHGQAPRSSLYGLFLQSAERARLTVSSDAQAVEAGTDAASSPVGTLLSFRGLDAFAWVPGARARLPLLHRADFDVVISTPCNDPTTHVEITSPSHVDVRWSMSHFGAYRNVIWDLICAYRIVRGSKTQEAKPREKEECTEAPYLHLRLAPAGMSVLLCRTADSQVPGVVLSVDAADLSVELSMFSYGQTVDVRAREWSAEHNNAHNESSPLLLPCAASLTVLRHRGKPITVKAAATGKAEIHASPEGLADIIALGTTRRKSGNAGRGGSDASPDVVVLNDGTRTLEVAHWRPEDADCEAVARIPARGTVCISGKETAARSCPHVDSEDCLLAELNTQRRAALVVREAAAADAAGAGASSSTGSAPFGAPIVLEDGERVEVGAGMQADVLQTGCGTRVVVLSSGSQRTDVSCYDVQVSVPSLVLVLVVEGGSRCEGKGRSAGELLTVALTGLRVGFVQRREDRGVFAAMEENTFDLEVTAVQVESDRCCQFPVVLRSNAPAPMLGLASRPGAAPSVRATLGLCRVLWRREEQRLRWDALQRTWVRCARVSMPLAFTANVDDETVALLKSLMDMLRGDDRADAHAIDGTNGQHPPHADAADSEECESLSDPHALFVRKIEVSEIRALLYLRVSTSAAPVDVDGMPLALGAVHLAHLVESPNTVARTFGQHYMAGAIMAAPTLLASLNVLGNPARLFSRCARVQPSPSAPRSAPRRGIVSLLTLVACDAAFACINRTRSVGSGVQDMVTTPLQSLINLDPAAAIAGAAAGGVGLVRNTSAWGVDAVGGFAGAVARIIDHTLQLKKKERQVQDDVGTESTSRALLSSQRPQEQTVKVESFALGLAAGIDHLGEAVERGVTGQAGIAGVFLKPLSGVFGAVALAAQGVAETMGLARDARVRVERVQMARLVRTPSRWHKVVQRNSGDQGAEPSCEQSRGAAD